MIIQLRLLPAKHTPPILHMNHIRVKDVPESWNAKMQQYLGIRPKNYSEGCLQDIHWAMGVFGYFPTYVLGNVFAAQLFSSFAKNHPNWEIQVTQNDFSLIHTWLKNKIYSQGRHFKSLELIQLVTGSELSEKAYFDYLKTKYSKIYKKP